MLLAIDPGACSGWALFDDAGRLVSCGLDVPPPVGVEPLRVLVEVPRARPSDPDPQSILTLGIRAGEWGGRYPQREYVTPNDWKGSTPKQISHARIFAKLDAKEQDTVARAGKGVGLKRRENMMDAIGLGLHGVGRNANGR